MCSPGRLFPSLEPALVLPPHSAPSAAASVLVLNAQQSRGGDLGPGMEAGMGSSSTQHIQ